MSGLRGDGKPTYAAPEAISVRWATHVESMRDAEGEEFVSRAKVFVPRDMRPGDVLNLGAMTSATPANPWDAEDSFKVRVFSSTPDIRANNFLRQAVL